MKKLIRIGILSLILGFCLLASLRGLGRDRSIVADPNKNEKVLICHKPPGNSSNAQNIWVSTNAVAAHMAHGDFMGACESAMTCQELCELQYNDCVNSAGGDADLLKFCASQKNTCISQCGPADPGPTK